MDLYTSGYLCRRHYRRVLVKKEKKERKKRKKKKELSLTSAAALTNQQVHQGAASQPIFLAQGFIYKDYTTPTSKRKKK